MYKTIFYIGDYRERQYKANRDGCVGYIEAHLNSSKNRAACYTVCIVGSNASKTSKEWAEYYSRCISETLGVPLGGDNKTGVKMGGYGGRGNNNLRYTNMPAILTETLFTSNPQQASWIKSPIKQKIIANVLVDSITKTFPEGGIIGFSIGHKGKISNPYDRGAQVYGGGYESDYTEIILLMAEKILSKI